MSSACVCNDEDLSLALHVKFLNQIAIGISFLKVFLNLL